MIDRDLTVGAKLNIAATLTGIVTIIVGMSLAWGRVDARLGMAEHRLSKVEGADLQRQSDHDLLVELRTDVKQIKAVLERMERQP